MTVTFAAETLRQLDQRTAAAKSAGRKTSRSAEIAKAVNDPVVRTAASQIRQAAEALKRRSAGVQEQALLDQILRASWELLARHSPGQPAQRPPPS